MPAAKTPTPRKMRRAAPRPTVGSTPRENFLPSATARCLDWKTLSAHAWAGLLAPENVNSSLFRIFSQSPRLMFYIFSEKTLPQKKNNWDKITVNREKLGHKHLTIDLKTCLLSSKVKEKKPYQLMGI